jgi:hypothetical protein
MGWVLGGAGIAIAAIVVVLVLVLRDNGSSSKTSATSPVASWNSLPGVSKTKAPWAPEYAHLSDRLQPLGLSALSQEQLAFHIHQHLDIFVDGKRVSVPQFIGINDSAYITELHTHSTDGIVHVESARKVDYTLGQFFAEWGVFLNGRCAGGYCNGLKWYVNGVRKFGNPQKLVLKNHEEIAIVIGKPPKKIPATFAWAANGV